MREKARAVLGEMERRMGLLGFSWAEATAAQVYTVFPVHWFLADEIVRRGAAEPASTGTSAARPWSASTTKWTAATSASNA